MPIGYAELTGTIRQPELIMTFNGFMTHPSNPRITMLDWVRAMPGRRFEKTTSKWHVTGIGPNPDGIMAAAGIEVIFPDDNPEFAGITQLGQLYMPVSMLGPNGRIVYVRHRFAGYDDTLKFVGAGATWDKKRGFFKVPVGDLLIGKTLRPNVIWDPRAIERAVYVHSQHPAVPGLERAAQVLGSALTGDSVPDEIALVESVLGTRGADYGVKLFGYQEAGHLAVAAGHRGLFDAPGVGKANPYSEPILTPAGWVPMGELSVGSTIVDTHGGHQVVEAIYEQGEQPIYRVNFSDGSHSRCTIDHLWQVTDRRHRKLADRGVSVKSLKEILDAGLTLDGTANRWSIPMTEPVLFDPQEQPLDPYLVGALIGDGSLSQRSTPGITTDDELVHSLILPDGVGTSLSFRVNETVATYRFPGLAKYTRPLGLYGKRSEEKTIPDAYKLGPVGARVALLQGLLDTDGSPLQKGDKPRSSVEYGTVSKQLAEDVQFLVQSLGGATRITEKVPSYEYNGETRQGQLYYRMALSLPSWVTPFRLTQKLVRWTPRTKYEPGRRIVSVEADGTEQARCVRVSSPDSLYVTRDFVVTHNTTQFLAAAKVMGAERTIIVCPPLVLTNWARETVMAGNATEDQIAVFIAGKKEPSLEGKTVVIIGDSLIASRPETVKRIIEWNPTVLGYDEAHRAKTFGSKRSEAILDMVAAIPGIRSVAITGTPMFAGPHELVPLLELTGHLVPIFGGHAAFLARYCTQDRYGGWHARKEHLGELRATLVEHVWVRRTKEQVLPDLPPKRMAERVIDVDISGYKQAHKDVMEKLTLWLEEFALNNGRLPTHGDPLVPDSLDEIQEYAQESIRFVSMLRRAAGLAKVKGAAEHIQQFVEATSIRNSDGTVTYTRPLIVWTHHEDVTAAMADAIPKELGPTGVIKGGTSNTERNRVVDEFQAGRMPVIVGSITAAGVGITLTRSSDVLFVETDWTPALVGQAIDRAYRFGQTKSVLAEFLIALGTLDEHIQKVLIKKAETLATVMGDSTGDMAVTQIASDDLNTATDIMVALIDEAIALYSKKRNI